MIFVKDKSLVLAVLCNVTPPVDLFILHHLNLFSTSRLCIYSEAHVLSSELNINLK